MINSESLLDQADQAPQPSLVTPDEEIPDARDSSSQPLSTPREYVTFINSPFPVLVIDADFRILFANDACDRLFAKYYFSQQTSFTAMFAQALGEVALHELRRAIKTPSNGFSWKGLIRNKAREAGTTLTKTYLFPLYGTSERTMLPDRFVVLFDDITEENRSLLRSVFLSLLEASKLKDNDTGRHIQRVNFYSRRLSEDLFDRPGYEIIDKDFIEDISFLAAMHDVGKIGTPDDILNKQGRLTDWEMTIMREHTINGAYILSTYPNPMAREIALYHHERWDGSGYPYRLEGQMIPLAARIVTIADVYDALRMQRAYKQPFSHIRAVAFIIDSAGRLFDPALIEVFKEAETSFRQIYRENAD